MFATSSDGVPSVASTATDPPMSLTRSPLTSSKSRLVGPSMVQCAIPPVLPVRYPSLLTIYLILISHPRKVKTYRERNPSHRPGPPRPRAHAPLIVREAHARAVATSRGTNHGPSRLKGL